jgi:hypothetical protein
MFDIVDAGSGNVGLKARVNGMFVAAEIGTSNNQLRARSSSIGSWETFKFVQQSDGWYGLYSVAAGKYVAAASGTNSPMGAQSSSVSTSSTSWEKFQCQ